MRVPSTVAGAKKPTSPAKPTPAKQNTRVPSQRVPQQFGGYAGGTGTRVPEAATRSQGSNIASGMRGVRGQQEAAFQQHYGVLTPVDPSKVNISQLQGNKNQNISYYKGFHLGTDFAAPVGTDVRSQKEGGVVKFSGKAGAYGNQVIIQYPDGTQSVLSHLSQSNVTPGQKVAKGEVVGASGNTGRSTGAHLDLEARQGGTAASPASVWGKTSAYGTSNFGQSWKGAEGGVGGRSANVGASPEGGGTIQASGGTSASRTSAFSDGNVGVAGGNIGQQVNLGALGVGTPARNPKPPRAAIAMSPITPTVNTSQAQTSNPGTVTRIKGGM